MDTSKKINNKNMIIFIIVCIFLSRFLIIDIYNSYYIDKGISLNDKMLWGDAGWYNSVRVNGYSYAGYLESGESVWAFFPLYPLLISLICNVIHVKNIGILVFVVSSIITAVSLYISYKYIMLTRKDSLTVYTFIILMTFGAYTIYYSMFYSEVLFFLFLILGLYCLERKQYLRAGICGVFLSASRMLGSFFVFAIIAKYIMEYFEDKKFNFENCKGLLLNMLKNEKFILSVLIVPLGLILFMLHLQGITGDPFSFFRVLTAWKRGIGTVGILKILNSFIGMGNNLLNFYYSVYFIIGIYLIISSFKNKRFIEALLCTCFILSALSSGQLYSIARYLVGSIVFMLAFLDKIMEMKKYSRIFTISVWCLMEISCIFMLFEGSQLLF